MNRALLRLLLDTVRGRLVRSARLVRQPRYLVALVVFAAWVGFTAVRPFLGAVTRGTPFALDVPVELLRLAQLGGALVLAAGLTLGWLLPRRRLSLGFSSAELAILSPAPVLRRELIQYAIVKNQAGILFGALVMAVFMGSGGPGSRLLWLAAFWLFLTNADLHGKGSALLKARLRALPPGRAWRMRVVGIAAGLLIWAVVLGSVAGPAQRLLADVRAATEGGTLSGLLATAWSDLGHGPHRVVLAPLLWLLEPGVALLAPGGGAGWVALSLLPGLVLVILQNEWVVRSQFRFEEAAIEEARREAAKKDPRSRYRRTSRASRMRAPFELRPRGTPGLALLWKAMLQVRRGSLAGYVGVGVTLATAAGLGPSLLGAPAWVSATVLIGGFGFLAVGAWFVPMGSRNDLHSDVLRLEVIRPWPVPGRQLFAWEVLAPTVEGLLVIGFAACLIVSADLGMQLGGAAPMRAEILGEVGLAGAPSVPLVVLGLLPLAAALALLSATLLNLAVLYMPGWVPLGPHKSKGAAAFGHNLLISLALFLCHGIVLFAAAILVGAIVLAQTLLLRLPLAAWELPLLGLVAAVPVVAAAALGLSVGAALWEGLDASREVLDPTG